MLRKIGRNITIFNAIAFTAVILFGGASIMLTQSILHNAYKVEEESEHISLIDGIHTNAYRLVLAMHHFLIDADKMYSHEVVSLISKIETETEQYKALEEAELYEEKNLEIELLDSIIEDIRELKDGLTQFFEKYTKADIFDRDELLGLETFAYDIETATAKINRIHFDKIAEWQKESLSSMWKIMIIYIAFILVGGISIFAGHRFLIKTIVEPIKTLAGATLEFAEGNLGKRVHTASQTEIGLLYQSFNKMAEKIQDHNAFLKKFNEELERKVQERTLELQETNEQLQRTQDALIRAEKIAAIGELATGVAHEIRNPLNSLSINMQGLVRDIQNKCGAEECRFHDIVNIIQYELKRTNNILDNFVNFAKFPEPKFMQNNINQIIREVTAVVSSESEEAGVVIELSLSDDIPLFKLDRPQMKEVLMNLSQNAINAMPRGGLLKITSSMRNHSVAINVSDTGTGIPEKNLNKIFMPFFSTREKGLGLGLPIVKRIVEGHGGYIKCQSSPEGTLFEVTLPMENS